MKKNVDKCHLLDSINDSVAIWIGNLEIGNTKREKLVIQLDNKLSFDYHLSEICKKSSSRLYALGRVAPHMKLIKKKDFKKCHFQLLIQLLPTYMDLSLLHY